MSESYKTELGFALEPPRPAFKISTEEEYLLSKKLRSVNYDEFIKVLREDTSNTQYLRNHVTTKVKTMFGDKYLAVVDCDGESAKEIATYNLDERGLTYFVIISSYKSLSTQHYWIICNYAGDMSEILTFMKSIPGNDQRYVDCCIRKQEINLRAYPKNYSVPVFGNYEKELGKLSIGSENWIRCFHDYWYSDDIKEVLQEMVKKEIKIKNQLSDLRNYEDLKNIGKHFSPDIYEKIQAMYIVKEIEKPIILNSLYGMEYGMVEN